MTRILVLIGAMALASCTALKAQAGPYDYEYKHNIPPWDSYNGSGGDRRREQDERAGYIGSTDPAYDPDGRNKQLRREYEQAEAQREADRQAQEQAKRDSERRRQYGY